MPKLDLAGLSTESLINKGFSFHYLESLEALGFPAPLSQSLATIGREAPSTQKYFRETFPKKKDSFPQWRILLLKGIPRREKRIFPFPLGKLFIGPKAGNNREPDERSCYGK